MWNTIARRIIAVAATAAVIAGLGACSNSADEALGSSTANGTETSKTTVLKVAAMPIADLGAFYYALDSGEFKKAGLDVQTVDTTSGAAGIASLVSGDVDIAYSGTDGALKAAAKNLPVKIIAGSGLSRADGDKDSVGFVVPGNITSPKQLEGATIATMALGNINQAYSRKWLDSQGVDSSTVKFVEIPSSEQVAALENGNIQGSILPDPFASQAIDKGSHIIGWPYRTGQGHDTLVSVWTASDSTLKDKKDAVRTFLKVLDEANQQANDETNHEAVVNAILSHTKLTKEVADNIVFFKWSVKADRAKINEVADTLSQYGLLDGKPDLDKLIVTV